MDSVSARGLVQVHRARIVDENKVASLYPVGNCNSIDIERLAFWHFESNEAVAPLISWICDECMGENKILGANPLPFTPTTLPGIIVNGWFIMIGTAQAFTAQKIPNRAAWQSREEPLINPRWHLDYITII
jgi:hypothetical protein